MKTLPRLYAIADASFGDPVELARALFAGGARLVQVRNKTGNTRELLEQVERILDIAPEGGRVIVNDRVDVTLITNAAGVHLGQIDLPIDAARKILGNDRIVGFSTHNVDQAIEADQMPIDYVAIGPIFRTFTKKNADPVVGLERLGEICNKVQKPVVAIGGITLENVRDVFKAGADSVAVIRDVLNTPNVAARVREWLDVIEK